MCLSEMGESHMEGRHPVLTRPSRAGEAGQRAAPELSTQAWGPGVRGVGALGTGLTLCARELPPVVSAQSSAKPWSVECLLSC